MKLKSFIFLDILVILLLSLTVFSQDSKSEEATIGKKERRELKKFTDEFVKDLRITNDIGQVSEKFFVADFKTRLAGKKDSFFDQEVTEPISDGERYNYMIAVVNFYNLLRIFKEDYDKTAADDGEYSDLTEVENYLPSHILELFKRSKWLRFMAGNESDDNEDDSYTLEDIQSMMADLNIISDAIRIEIKQRKPKSYKKSKKFELDCWVKECAGDRCLGLPENTIIFKVANYSMLLTVIRVNNGFKIAGIEPFL